MGIGIDIGISFKKGASVSYGANQVLNGSFDTDLSDWINDSSYWQWDAGRAHHPSIDAFHYLRQTTAADVSKSYLLEFDYELVSGVLRLIVSNSGAGTVTYTESTLGTGKFSQVVTNVNRLEFSRLPGNVTDMYIDNVSLREIL